MVRRNARRGRNGVVGAIRRRPYIGAAAALATGVRYAYNNRAAIGRVATRVRTLSNNAAAVISRVRSRTRSRTQDIDMGPTTRRLDYGSTDNGTGSDMSVATYNYGRRVSSSMPGVLRSAIQTVVGYVRRVNQFDSVQANTTTPGSLSLDNVQVGTGNNSAPLYLVDVTSWFNNNSGTLSYAQPIYQLNFTNIGLAAFFGTGDLWSIEDSSAPASSTATVPNASDFLKYVSVKMQCYGATDRPTKFSIDLIKLKEDYLHPEFVNGLAPTFNSTLGVSYEIEKDAFWQSMVRPYMYNTIVDSNYKASSKVISLMHKEFILQEKLSTEPSRLANTGHFKTVTMNLNLNKIQKYNWSMSTYATAAQLNSAVVVNDVAQPANVVAPKDRIYMMIRATSAFNGAKNPALHPSFDLAMRSYHQNVV